ncbi:MAG TPA: PRC-barrel domain-containing protein [Geminicoccaceae bacterium]|nr:PRC-barrel domain-containing protein [Geminicoccaceae bacterium]
MLWSVYDTRDYQIRATDGLIGTVSDVLFEDQTSTIRYIVVDTGGWLTGRRVLIAPAAFGEPDRIGRIWPVSLTREKVKNSPEISTDQPVSRQQEAALHTYYDWAPYWGAPMAAGMAPYAYGVAPYWGHPERAPSARPEAPPEEPQGDPHLRSANEVIGYYIEARDGDIGHVEDLLAETASWVIRYVVVDTRNWWPGKRVLVSTQWMSRVDWAEQKVWIELTRDEIKAGPEYRGLGGVDRLYEERLHQHYGRTGYWI